MSSDREITEDELLNAALQKVAGVESIPEPELEDEFDNLDEPEEPKWDPDPEAGIRRLEAVLFLAKSRLPVANSANWLDWKTAPKPARW